jgi:hypothetical protein
MIMRVSLQFRAKILLLFSNSVVRILILLKHKKNGYEPNKLILCTEDLLRS